MSCLHAVLRLLLWALCVHMYVCLYVPALLPHMRVRLWDGGQC